MSMEKIGNRYLIVKLIGEGGMADVFLAIDTTNNKEVAIKVLRGELNSDPVNLARFKREADSIMHLSHPNVVEVYDVGEDDNKNYIVMEYVRGKSLKQLVKTRGAMNPDEAINIMKQLVSATGNAHKNGIIHRDIKSQNVLIKDDGTVKLSDFGIAIANDSAQLTQAETVMGSVHYIAPEVAKGEKASPQSDIYSLGIVFYEMLTGNVPFHGDSAVEIAMKHLHNEIPSVKQFNPTLPQSVENIVIRATAKNKTLRYGNCEEMYNDLATCLDFSRSKEGKLILSEPKKPVKKEPEAKLKKKKKKKKHIDISVVLAIFGAVVLSLTILAGIYLLNGTGNYQNDKFNVPNVVGYTLDDAKTVLNNMEIVIQAIEYEASDEQPKGKIIKTEPASGTLVNKGTYLTLYVSEGHYFTIEDYKGKNINDIKVMLETEGFKVLVTEVEDGTVAVGTILDQSVENGRVFSPVENRLISFHVACDVSFTIPADIIGMDIEKAKSKLEDLGGKVVLSQLSVDTVPVDPDTGELQAYKAGVVIDASPAAGTYYTQSADTSITLFYY